MSDGYSLSAPAVSVQRRSSQNTAARNALDMTFALLSLFLVTQTHEKTLFRWTHPN